MISVLGLSSRSCVGFHRDPGDHASPILAITRLRSWRSRRSDAGISPRCARRGRPSEHSGQSNSSDGANRGLRRSRGRADQFTLPVLWSDDAAQVLPNGERMASVIHFPPSGLPVGKATSPLVASGRVGNASFEDRVEGNAWKSRLHHVGGAEAMKDRGVAVGRAYDRTLAPEAIYRTFVLTPVQSARLGPGPVDPDPD